MGICQAMGWAALIQSVDPATAGIDSNRPQFYTVPVMVWKECGDQVVGLVNTDSNGNDLPYPVPAPNVFGFVKYIKVADDFGVTEVPPA